MSNFDQTPPNQPPDRSWQVQRHRSGCLTAFMLVVGIILLLPGLLCAFILLKEGSWYGDPLTGFVTLLALGGLGLIAFAVTR